MNEGKFRILLTFLVQNVVELIVNNDQIDELEAVRSFYTSKTYEMLEREETKFWWFSPEELYEEYSGKKLWEAL